MKSSDIFYGMIKKYYTAWIDGFFNIYYKKENNLPINKEDRETYDSIRDQLLILYLAYDLIEKGKL